MMKALLFSVSWSTVIFSFGVIKRSFSKFYQSMSISISSITCCPTHLYFNHWQLSFSGCCETLCCRMSRQRHLWLIHLLNHSFRKSPVVARAVTSIISDTIFDLFTYLFIYVYTILFIVRCDCVN